jgi:hypothetical protein
MFDIGNASLITLVIFTVGAFLSFASAIVAALGTSKKNQTEVTEAEADDDPDIAGIVIGRYGK